MEKHSSSFYPGIILTHVSDVLLSGTPNTLDQQQHYPIRLILSGLSLSLTHNGKFPIFRGDKKGTLYHLIENLPLASVAETICKLGGPLHVTMETDAQ